MVRKSAGGYAQYSGFAGSWTTSTSLKMVRVPLKGAPESNGRNEIACIEFVGVGPLVVFAKHLAVIGGEDDHRVIQ